MGYRGNYTGYSVSGIDVFLWILLTAGTLGFPIAVVTICYIKKHFKEKLPTDEDEIEQSPSKLKKMGIMGPYFNSEDNLSKQKTTNLNEQDLDKNGRVRFKEDPTVAKEFSKQNPIIKNISYPNTYEPRNMDKIGNQAFVPLAKIPVNFNPSFIRQNNNSIRETRPPPQEQIYSLSDSLSDSNNLQLSNKDLSSLDIKEKRESFENLYTQVQPQANRTNSRRSNDTSMHNSSNRDYNYDSQPVYMNTS